MTDGDTPTRECVVCGEDVLGRDYVQVDGSIVFVLRGQRMDQTYVARADHDDEMPYGYAEYFCRGCIGTFEEMMWVRIDKERASEEEVSDD